MDESTSRGVPAAGALVAPEALATVSAQMRWPSCTTDGCGPLVLDADEAVLREIIAPALVRELQRLVRAARPLVEDGRDVAVGEVPAPRSAVEDLLGVCDSCRQVRATFALTYPDVRRRVCAQCMPEDLLVVAEPLDDDDELATDARPALERMTP